MSVKSTFPSAGLRTIALLLLFAGAAGSLVWMFRVGHNNKSILLLCLFTIWVLSPFVALFIASRRNWSDSATRAIYNLILILAPFSLIAYSGVLSPQGTKPAFVFLIVPLLSWTIIAITALVISRSKRDKKTQTQ